MEGSSRGIPGGKLGWVEVGVGDPGSEGGRKGLGSFPGGFRAHPHFRRHPERSAEPELRVPAPCDPKICGVVLEGILESNYPNSFHDPGLIQVSLDIPGIQNYSAARNKQRKAHL